MSDRRFIEAAFPESFTILGSVLRPFSLGHSIALRRFDCAFIKGGEAGVNDLLLGVIVCSKTFAEVRKFFSDTRWPERVYRWGQALHEPTGFFRRKAPVIDWQARMEMFVRYIGEGLKEPAMHYELSDNKSDIPWEEHLIQTMLKLGMKEAEILDYHLPALRIRYVTCLELSTHGAIRFQNEDDREMLEHTKKVEAFLRERDAEADHG